MPGPVGILCGAEENMKPAAALIVKHSKARNMDEVLISWSRGKRSGTFKYIREEHP